MNRLKSKETTEMLCLREIHVSFSFKKRAFSPVCNYSKSILSSKYKMQNNANVNQI